MSRHHRSPPNSAAAASEVESVRRPGLAKRAAGCRRSGYSCWWRSRRKAEGHPPRPPSLFRQRRADRLRLRNGATPVQRLRWFGVRWHTGRFQAEHRHFVSSIPHLEEEIVSRPLQHSVGAVVDRRQRRLRTVPADQLSEEGRRWPLGGVDELSR
jgi:hypothetical protein